jgi:hypothetical protein
MQSHEGGYFISLKVDDRAGVFASIATLMAKNDISLGIDRSAGRPSGAEAGPQTVILVTHATTESNVAQPSTPSRRGLPFGRAAGDPDRADPRKLS